MPRPKGKWREQSCSVCRHEQRGRIDYLLVTAAGETGSGRRGLAEKFGLSESSIYSHGKQHISMVAEEGISVLQNYRGLFNAHRSRWLVALERGDDEAMVRHGRAMSEMLWKIGRLTREIAPNVHTAIQQNIFMTPDYYNFERRALKVLRRHPEAMQDWLAEFREAPSARLIEASTSAA
jgi:hypothetical protein